MRNKYLYVLIAFLFVMSIFAQTTETFETEIDNSTSFTDNSQVFNITSQAGGTFDVANFAGTGWNGTAIDNKYIDNSGFADIGIPVQFTIKSAGATPFHLKSVYLFLSQSDLNPGSGSCTITGKLNGLTVFTATSSTGFNDPTNFGVNNGFTFIDLTSYGSADNSNVIIDEYVITTTGSFEYVALDAMTWEYDCSGLVAPTANAQNFCDAATVANLVATGNSLKWYADALGGSALVGTTALATGTYYVTSSSIGCESARIPVSVTITPSSDNVTTVSACDSYFWNGTTYTTSGVKTGPTANCVTEKLDLTITTSSDNVTTVSACDSYLWNGTTYTTSGIKIGPTVNCVTEKLDLTITPSSDNVTTVSACDSYFWNGTTYTTSGIKTGPTANCVTEKLDLTITTSSDNVTIVSACDSYLWANNATTYTTSGVYTGTTTNCVTEKLDLTITTTPAPTGTVSQTFCGSETVSLLNVTGTGIIWYDAATLGIVVPGSTVLVDGTTYYASQTIDSCESASRLAVTVTAGGCLGLENFDASNLRWYPNPTTGILNINYSKAIEEISVINLLGQTLFTNKTKATEVQIDLSNLSSATYFVKVVSDGKSKIIKVNKQ